MTNDQAVYHAQRIAHNLTSGYTLDELQQIKARLYSMWADEVSAFYDGVVPDEAGDNTLTRPLIRPVQDEIRRREVNHDEWIETTGAQPSEQG